MHDTRAALVFLTFITLGSNGACGGHTAKPVDGGRPADAAAVAACERACQHYTAVCGGADDCATACDVFYRYTYPAGCAAEMKVYFDCMAAETSMTCDSEFIGAISALNCPEQWAPLGQCEATQGADCLAEPASDPSCTVTGKPPHFYLCKLGAKPPGTCASYGLDGMYCCP
jgi:hypothetical protein